MNTHKNVREGKMEEGELEVTMNEANIEMNEWTSAASASTNPTVLIPCREAQPFPFIIHYTTPRFDRLLSLRFNYLSLVASNGSASVAVQEKWERVFIGKGKLCTARLK